MDSAPRKSSSRIVRGKIYSEVYAKRADDADADTDAELERAWLESGELRFAARGERALADGIFLLKVPAGLELTAADTFSRQFFAGEGAGYYGRFRELGPAQFGDPLLGFHSRVDQIEQFLLERRFWRSHYPAEIAIIGEALTRLSQQILRSILAHARIPAQDWSQATGGCSALGGSYHLTFNHYRPLNDGRGLSSHKDDGFLTILRTTAPGLEVNRQDRWERVPVDSEFFVVNFGLSMEILTAQLSTPIAAIMHRVRHQTQDRSSYGHFTSSCCLPGSDQGIYCYHPEEGLERVCASRELIDNNDYEIYEGTDESEEQTP